MYRRILLSSTAYLAVPYFFSHYLVIGKIFGRKKLLDKKCVLIFYKVFEFHENPSCGIRVIASGDEGMMKLTVAFRNFAIKPEGIYKVK